MKALAVTAPVVIVLDVGAWVACHGWRAVQPEVFSRLSDLEYGGPHKARPVSPTAGSRTQRRNRCS